MTVAENTVFSGLSEVQQLTLTNPVNSGPAPTMITLAFTAPNGGPTASTVAIPYTGNPVVDAAALQAALNAPTFLSIGGFDPLPGTDETPGFVTVTADASDTVFTFNFAATAAEPLQALQSQGLSMIAPVIGGTGTGTMTRLTAGSGQPIVVYTVTFTNAGQEPLIVATPGAGLNAIVSEASLGGVGTLVNNNTSLTINNTPNAVFAPINIPSNETIAINGAGDSAALGAAAAALVNVNGVNTIAGTVTLQSTPATNDTIAVLPNGELAITGVVQDTQPYSPTIPTPPAPATLSTFGGGTLVLSGTNTYTGSTVVETGGVLNDESNNGLGINTSAQQTLTVSGSTGTFTLGLTGYPASVTTVPLAYNVPATGGVGASGSLQNAINAMLAAVPSLAGATVNVVALSSGSVFIVTFGGTLTGRPAPLFTVPTRTGTATVSVASTLAGGQSTTTVQSGATLQLQSFGVPIIESSLKQLTLNGTGVDGNGALENVNQGDNSLADVLAPLCDAHRSGQQYLHRRGRIVHSWPR